MSDLESLLEPIPGDAPAGPNLRLLAGDTTIADIEELRREVDPAVDPGGRGKDADWPAAARACRAALAEKSKDLQLAAHLAEALARTDGYAGALEGVRLVRLLVERFWDGLHPGVEDGEIIFPVRARWISWLGTSRDFLAAVKGVPITSGPGVGEYGWADYEGSQRVDDAGIRADQTEHDEMVGLGMIPGSTWKTALAATPTERLREIVGQLGECETEIRSLNLLCESKFPEETPNLIELAGFFSEAKEYLEEKLAGLAPAAAAAGGEGGPGEASAAAAPAAAPSAPGGPIASRDDAYRRLKEAAEYLRRTEPHSPVPYLVERAVSWGEMPFSELLADVLKDDKARNAILETLGMANK